MSAQAGTTGVSPRGTRSPGAPRGVVIEDIRDMPAMRAVEGLQLSVWGAEPVWTVPVHILYIAVASGGILLGASIDDKLVGFVLGFLGRQDGRLYHASHMLGIHPDYQRHGIGFQLKRRQRERALEQGLDLMTWTFDPLESRNAYFNLHKLGAITRTYRRDLYGEMDDALNRGLPSDRLVVEWHLDGAPRAPVSAPAVPIVVDRAGLPELHLVEPAGGIPVAISIPPDIQTLKREAPDAAGAWRLATRDAFSWAFDRGYVASDFADGRYILVREREPSA